MAEKLDVGVEKEEPKIGNIDIEMPKRIHHSEDYFKGYKAGWEVAKKNLLRRLSESGKPVEGKSIEEKPIMKKKSKKEEEVSPLMLAILGLALGGIVLFVIFNKSNRNRNPANQ